MNIEEAFSRSSVHTTQVKIEGNGLYLISEHMYDGMVDNEETEVRRFLPDGPGPLVLGDEREEVIKAWIDWIG